MDSREWNNLSPELARKTGATIVSYDRAGFGKSDLPEIPHDMQKEVEWLWQGLQELNLHRDLFLVGHVPAPYLNGLCHGHGTCSGTGY